MRSTLGGIFTGDNTFALLYVMYNPVCRRDIHQKQRVANRMLAEALLPVELEYLGQHKSIWFHIKSSWAVFKFAVKNRAMADCNPTLVLSASKQAHAAIFKDLNRMLLLVQNCERDTQTHRKIANQSILNKASVVKSLKKIPVQLQRSQATSGHVENHETNLPSQLNQLSVTEVMVALRSLGHNATFAEAREFIQEIDRDGSEVVPSQVDHQQRHDDAPKLFVDHFDLKRTFVEENIQEEARLSLLTLMIFPDAEDFGLSNDCKIYKQRFDENLKSFRNTFRALFRLSKELKSVDSSERLTRKERMFQRISDMMFGDEMKLMRNFHWLADEEAVDMFQKHQFPELETEYVNVPSVSDVLKQLVAKEKEKSVKESTICSQSQYGNNTHDNFFPSTLMTFAPITQEHSERCTDHVIQSASLRTEKGPGPNMERARPTMCSSQSTLAAAIESAGISHFNAAYSLKQDASSEDAIIMRAELFSARADIASMIDQMKNMEATLKIETANALAKEAELLQRATAAEAKVLALTAQVTDLQAFSAAKAKVLALSAQMSDLRTASQVAIVTSSSKPDMSANIDALSTELQSAQAFSVAAMKRAHDAEQELLLLRAEMKRTEAVAPS